MFGVNYRYELNPEKGTIKLGFTKKTWIAIAASNVLPFVALWAVGSYLEKQDDKQLAEDVENYLDKKED